MGGRVLRLQIGVGNLSDRTSQPRLIRYHMNPFKINKPTILSVMTYQLNEQNDNDRDHARAGLDP
jgi:hypothetical protein